MKILLVCNKSPWPPKDGGSLATFSLAKALIKIGASIKILAMNTSKHKVNQSSVPDILKNEMGLQLVDIDTDISLFLTLKDFFSFGTPYIATRFYSEKFRKELTEILLVEEFDVVQIEGLYVLQYLTDIRKHSKALIAFRPHNVEHEIWNGLAKNTGNIFKKIYFSRLSGKIKNLENNLINQYDSLIPISITDLDKFNLMGNQKPVHLVPAGVFPNEIPVLQKQTGPVNLFYIGALDWLPNQEGITWFVKNIWNILKEKHPNLSFNVAGRNAPHWFMKLLKKHHVYYLGEVDDAGTYMIMNGIMVVPLLSGSGIRVKIIEGMAHGKAIVATSIAAKGIPAKNQENILIADTPEDFVTCIEKLITDSPFKIQMAKNARDFALANYNNFDIAAELTTFYKKLF